MNTIKRLCKFNVLIQFNRFAHCYNHPNNFKILNKDIRRYTSYYNNKKIKMTEDNPLFKGQLYPEIEPFNNGFLKVSDIHNIYYEESGNPNGNPIIFIHGGPGGGVDKSDRQFFNPKLYRIILFDQRGSGKSTPAANLENNTTWDLVEDIEKLRLHLNIDKWVVFGGSWGSTLSLAYSQTYPETVKAIILRGIFLLREKEIKWFYQEGASFIFPDMWEKYLEPHPKSDHKDLLSAYHKILTGNDEKLKLKAAKAWSTWECATSKLYVDPAYIERAADDQWATQFARIECHYFVNKGFFKRDGYLLEKEQIDKIRNIPTFIVQGRYDVVCPMRSAWDLHRAWPEAEFKVINDAGHSSREKGISKELVLASDRFASL